ncbi:DSD1 family PLP-dependent enzyme [Thalassoroseus pseudoceratinae]|uniref:DSD1 family PLP-dependent enzyme n=1 Tax=Thalassoroseus pseudoceratinae TaxID=2713176 RepID=UPI001F1169C3|nr:DSD1 family PLP-dependent enzyme [Thalassoroseus pseudoceratinae]
MIQEPFGKPLADLDTPAMCIDLEAMDRNIERMASHMRERNVQWRPHQKCHKSPAIAHKLLDAGAIGMTCAKVSDAEVMAGAGVRDLLIANMIVGEQKLERLASLCRWADPVVACDHFVQAEALAEVCRRRGVTCRMIIEVDIGMNRVGVRPGRDTLELAQGIDKLEGVRLAGIMGYEGHLLRIADPDEKRRQINEAIGTLLHCRDRLLENGLNCDIVSAGGTGSYRITADCEGVTELQAGGGIFGDPFYRLECGLSDHESALTVLATVVSRPTLTRAVLDSGRKTLHSDLQLPIVKNFPDAIVQSLSAEHCLVELGPESQNWTIGDKVELFVGYADLTTVLHDRFHGIRDGIVETVWPILGRGKLQ